MLNKCVYMYRSFFPLPLTVAIIIIISSSALRRTSCTSSYTQAFHHSLWASGSSSFSAAFATLGFRFYWTHSLSTCWVLLLMQHSTDRPTVQFTNKKKSILPNNLLCMCTHFYLLFAFLACFLAPAARYPQRKGHFFSKRTHAHPHTTQQIQSEAVHRQIPPTFMAISLENNDLRTA